MEMWALTIPHRVQPLLPLGRGKREEASSIRLSYSLTEFDSIEQIIHASFGIKDLGVLK